MAVTVYCQPSDLTSYGLSEDALASIDPDVVAAQINAQASVMDTYFRSRYVLPFQSIDVSLTECNAVLAVYRLMVIRGYNPAAGADENIRLSYEDKMAWLRQVAAGNAAPGVLDSSSAPQADNGSRATLVSSSSRGFSSRGNQRHGGGFVGD